MTDMGTVEGAIREQERLEAKQAQGCDRLWRKLWKEHPRKMEALGAERPPMTAPVRGRQQKARLRDYILVIPERDQHNPFLQRHRLTSAVAESVASDFGLTVGEVMGRSRLRYVMYARFLCYKLLAEYGYSLAEVGRKMGGRDHSTVIHGVGKFSVYYERVPLFASCYDRHRKLLDAAMEERGAAE